MRNYWLSKVTHFTAILVVIVLMSSYAIAQTMETPFWKATVQKGGQIELMGKTEAVSLTLQPQFSLLYRADDPGLQLHMNNKLASRMIAYKRTDGRGMTYDLFRAIEPTAFVVKTTQVVGNEVQWTFAPSATGTLRASLSLTERFPVVRWQFRATRDGYMAVAFAPFAPVPVAQVASLWQPLIWQERRMPDSSYVSAEFMCPLPMTLAGQNGLSRGVSAHPSEVPFRMPTMDNSGFAVLLCNRAGQAQPTILAPFLGRSGTHVRAGTDLTFSASIIGTNGRTDQAYQTVARQLFAFKDYRRNGTCSLNETIQNMTRFAMDDQQCQWIPDLKASNYVTDVAGTVKNVSALHPLSVAIVSDDEQVFRRRALPMTEYLLSREKYLFSLAEDTKGQNPSHYLHGPAAEVSELAALYTYSKGNSPALKQYALDLSGKTRKLNLLMASEGNSWTNQLALYRMTRQPDYLEKARTGALAYIDTRINTLQTDFSDAHIMGGAGGQFWTDFTPKWMELLELYEETQAAGVGDKRFLEAARRGAAQYAMVAWLQPVVPAGNVTVHAGDSTRMIYLNRNLSPRPRPFPVQAQQIPAWRVSNVGLTPEASNTYNHNPAVLLTHYAAYMLRIGHYADDSFLRDIARSAVVGRYANYPGYTISKEYVAFYQRADYPLHDVNEMTYNQLYYNHVWPHIALLYDYLITDAEMKSGGRVKFPSQYAQGYAYLQSKVYGAAPGEFYGDSAVSVWLPANLLKTDNEQINYVSGYGNGNFYLALTNQSPEKQTGTVQLNADVVPFDAGTTYTVRVMQDNKPAPAMTMQNGKLTVSLSGHGITGLIVEKLAVKTGFQHKLKAMPELASSAGTASVGTPERALRQPGFSEQTTPQGKVTGLLLSWGQNLHNAYVWLSATEKDLKEARLHYTLDGTNYKTVSDNTYPFEFSIPLSDAERGRGFSYRVESVTVGGESVNTNQLSLK